MLMAMNVLNVSGPVYPGPIPEFVLVAGAIR
jgi:hypothetical protein